MTDKTAPFKRQADILRAYLANAGIELKQTNALEVIALMHEAKNWNTLQATGIPPGEEALYLISTLGTGLTSTLVVRGEASARRMFCSTTWRLAALLDEPMEIFGQDSDGGLPCLVAQSSGITYVTLEQAREAKEETIEEGRIVPAKPISLGVITDSKSYAIVAAALQRAFDTESSETRLARRAESARGQSAHVLSIDWDEAHREVASMTPVVEADLPPASELASVLGRFRDIKVLVSFVATVQG